MIMRKFFTIAMCALMVMPIACAFGGCGEDPNPNGTGKNYNITVWVGEGTKDLTKNQIKTFNETNEWGVTFNATIEEVSESKAAGDALQSKETAADIFCIAQDTLARVVDAGMTASLSDASVTAISEMNDAKAVEAAKVGDIVRAFPLTADNGYFMYYDKSVISDTQIGSLEQILEVCEHKGKKFSMNLTEDGGAWYAASFFYGAGCKSEWTTNEEGKFTAYDDTFDSEDERGVIALRGMQKLLKSDAYLSSAEVGDFTAHEEVRSAVVVSGTWAYNAAKKALNDNLGIAALPTFEIDGETYQMMSYLGYKFMVVKPQSDAYKSAYLQRLAKFLTDETCQRQRFDAVKWAPTNKNLQSDPSVISESFSVLKAAQTIPQGQYPTGWWAKMQVLVGNARDAEANNVSALKGALKNYSGTLNTLLNA